MSPLVSAAMNNFELSTGRRVKFEEEEWILRSFAAERDGARFVVTRFALEHAEMRTERVVGEEEIEDFLELAQWGT